MASVGLVGTDWFDRGQVRHWIEHQHHGAQMGHVGANALLIGEQVRNG